MVTDQRPGRKFAPSSTAAKNDVQIGSHRHDNPGFTGQAGFVHRGHAEPLIAVAQESME